MIPEQQEQRPRSSFSLRWVPDLHLSAFSVSSMQSQEGESQEEFLAHKRINKNDLLSKYSMPDILLAAS